MRAQYPEPRFWAYNSLKSSYILPSPDGENYCRGGKRSAIGLQL